jgi:hypothetical protein
MEPVTLGIAAVVVIAVVCGAVVHVRNLPFTREAAVFRASRWAQGSRLWPTQVAVFPSRVVRYTPRLLGHFEETIAISQVASVSVDAGVLFSDVIIETTGGSQPIRCHGHRKRDAEEIRRLINEAQAAPPPRASAS